MLRRIGLVCLLLLALSSTAWAAPPDSKSGAKALWQAFPLDPTGERVDSSARPEPSVRSEAVRALPEPAESESGPIGVALMLAAGIVAAALLLIGARRLKAPRRRRGSRPLSQTGWSAARQRILDYGEPSVEGPKEIAAWRHYPDIPGDGRVRTFELPPGETEPPPPPPAEWRSVA